MFVTNLTGKKLGINGRINLAANEVNRFIDNEDTDLVARVLRLEAALLVSVVRENGLTKTGITGKVVKTVGFDKGGASTAPRTAGVAEIKEAPKAVAKTKAVETKAVAAKTTAKSTKRSTAATPEKAKVETETSETQE